MTFKHTSGTYRARHRQLQPQGLCAALRFLTGLAVDTACDVTPGWCPERPPFPVQVLRTAGDALQTLQLGKKSKQTLCGPGGRRTGGKNKTTNDDKNHGCLTRAMVFILWPAPVLTPDTFSHVDARILHL